MSTEMAEQKAVAEFEGYRIDWMKVGAKHTKTQRQRTVLLNAVATIDRGDEECAGHECWLKLPTNGEALSVAFMPGEGIKATIKELRLPKVTHIAISNRVAPYGLYGIRAHYKGQQVVEVFVIDTGVGITPLFTRVWEIKAVAP